MNNFRFADMKNLDLGIGEKENVAVKYNFLRGEYDKNSRTAEKRL